MAHMGLGSDNSKAIKLISSLPNLYGDTAWVPIKSAISLIKNSSSEKLFFGSDNPIDGKDTYLHNKTGDRSLYQEYFNERPISTQQSGFVFVSQMRSSMPDAIGGVLWFGTDDANMTVFTPVYCCTDKVPVCYSRVDGADYITFSWNSSFWIFNWVANMVYPRYDLMIEDVRASQSEMETIFNDAQEGIESAASKLYAKDPAQAKAFLTNYTNMTAQSTLDTWKRLGEFLIVKYNDGVVKRMKDGKFERNSIGQPAGVIRPGYPKEFLEEYVKQTGDRYKMPE